MKTKPSVSLLLFSVAAIVAVKLVQVNEGEGSED